MAQPSHSQAHLLELVRLGYLIQTGGALVSPRAEPLHGFVPSTVIESCHQAGWIHWTASGWVLSDHAPLPNGSPPAPAQLPESRPEPSEPQDTVGFSGSRQLDAWQRHHIVEVLRELGRPRSPTIVTGGCVGVDAFVARHAHRLGLHVHTVLPSDHRLVDPSWKAHCTTYEQMPEGTDYRARNTRLVRRSCSLVAYPEHAEDDARSQRSGTWMTIRIARRMSVPIRVYVPPLDLTNIAPKIEEVPRDQPA